LLIANSVKDRYQINALAKEESWRLFRITLHQQTMHKERMDLMTLHTWSKRLGQCLLTGFFLTAILAPSAGQTEQTVEVTIKDSAFKATGVLLLPGVPITVKVVNEDTIRHDFSSTLLQGHLTQVEGNGVIAHGRGIEGAYVEPKKNAIIRFTTEQPGRFEFRCTIHPTMRGELLLMNVGAA